MEYRKLGRFRIDRAVAQGGMGEIVRSVDDAGREIALKTILKAFQENETFRDLFQREAEITFHLEHPNIVKAYRFESIGNQLVLALEYLDGVNLKDVLRHIFDKKLSIPLVLVLFMMKSVLRGLDYAHKKRDKHGKPLGIIHRDLNPSNIFLTYSGEVKILDFGISKATQKDIHQLTPHGELRGKMCYLSPEQIRGRELDHRSDIFACGIVLWEMITGKPLFLREHDSEAMEAIVNGDYTPASKLRVDLPKAFDDLLARALSVNPSQRFKDCAEFERALDTLAKKFLVPGTAEDELSIFIRTLFKKDVDENDPHFMSGYAWLLTQIKGQEEGGIQLARRIALQYATSPYIQLNYARCLLWAGDKIEGLRVMRRLVRVESLEEMAQDILEWSGVRRAPVIQFLPRSNLINNALGRIRHRILGPTPFQQQFLAA
ncbi:MAG: protein kinase [Deltaproteobacteria bacterium]|nr:protein kinase [Deltaproteobacteria bacterium]